MAGLLSSYLGNNDAYKWLDQNRNSLAQGFAGITGATSFGDGAKGAAYGLLNGAQTDQNNQKLAQQKQETEQIRQQAAATLRNQYNRPDLADAVISQGLPTNDAFNIYFNDLANASKGPTPTADMQNWEYNQTHPGFLDAMNGQQQAQTTYSTTPGYATDANGNTVSIQYGNNGSAVQSQLPDGLTVIDPAAMAGQKAGSTLNAKTIEAAKANLPSAQNTVSQTLKTIDALRNDKEGQVETFGTVGLGPLQIPQQFTGAYPGTKKADFAAMRSQLQGQVFGQARQMLKGGGQITDYEGQRAEDAIARINTATSLPAFMTALDDFEQAVKDGYTKLEATANGQEPPQMFFNGQGGGAGGDLKTKYGLE